MSGHFRLWLENGIAELIFDHPPVNAFNSSQWLEIADTLKQLGQDDAVRVIIIAARGNGFCAGVDIKELARDKSRITAVNRGNYDTFKAIHLNPKPVIAALHGFVLGGGIGISGAADIIIASECTTFGVPEIDRGAMGGGAHLQRMFPVQKVRYMYFTGHMINAHEAYRLGAVERVVKRAELMREARAIATSIAAKSPAMVALAKQSLTGVEDGNLEEKYLREQGYTLKAYELQDSREARDAFVEKRDPDFNDD